MKNLADNQTDNQMKRPEVYESPSIEVIEVEIEQGFQASSGPSRPGGGGPSW